MKNILLLLYILLFINSEIYPQNNEEMVIGITDFLYDENDVKNKKYVGSISNNVFDAFATSKLFTLVDRSKLETINQELDRNKDEWHLLADFLVEQGKRLGASHLLVGEIEFIRFERPTMTKLKIFDKKDNLGLIKATVDLNFNIIDVETGTITETVNMDFGAEAERVGATDSAMAILNLKDEIKEKTSQFIYEQWPQKYEFIKIEEEGKRFQSATFYIRGGYADNLKPGYKFKVLKVEEFDLGDGNMDIVEKELGEAVIDEVNSSQVSLCKIISGKKEILDSVDKGETIICKRVH